LRANGIWLQYPTYFTKEKMMFRGDGKKIFDENRLEVKECKKGFYIEFPDQCGGKNPTCSGISQYIGIFKTRQQAEEELIKYKQMPVVPKCEFLKRRPK
jgi:hypothetical protein